MNVLLLEPAELGADGHAEVRGRRALHLCSVLHATIGQVVRIGVVDGSLGTATVTGLGPESVSLLCTLERPPAPVHDVLLLAVPRPKVLLRMLAHAASLGFARIVLCRSWRVEKSHLRSTAMLPAVQRTQLLLGLEQAVRTQLPEVLFFPLWKPMVEDHLPNLGLPARRFCGHPTAGLTTHELVLPRGAPFTLALGPDGGFTPYEVQTLAACGFHAIAAGPAPQRTETALAVLAGQLDLLRRHGSLSR